MLPKPEKLHGEREVLTNGLAIDYNALRRQQSPGVCYTLSCMHQIRGRTREFGFDVYHSKSGFVFTNFFLTGAWGMTKRTGLPALMCADRCCLDRLLLEVWYTAKLRLLLRAACYRAVETGTGRTIWSTRARRATRTSRRRRASGRGRCNGSFRSAWCNGTPRTAGTARATGTSSCSAKSK